MQEQVQDAKVISFKKRRRKNSRRTMGHRQVVHLAVQEWASSLLAIGDEMKSVPAMQYLTGLRITGINGIIAPPEAAAQAVVA